MTESEKSPQEQAQALIQASLRAREKLIGAIQTLQEDLSYLQMAVKYMQFDLEATRRERDALIERLKKYEV